MARECHPAATKQGVRRQQRGRMSSGLGIAPAPACHAPAVPRCAPPRQTPCDMLALARSGATALRRAGGSDQQLTSLLRQLSAWATVDPTQMTEAKPGVALNIVGGKWAASSSMKSFPDPLTGKKFMETADTTVAETQPFIDSLKAVTKSGVHNPFKNPER
eukprot:138311-Chlamydomonas_euryale.AAC.3